MLTKLKNWNYIIMHLAHNQHQHQFAVVALLCQLQHYQHFCSFVYHLPLIFPSIDQEKENHHSFQLPISWSYTIEVSFFSDSWFILDIFSQLLLTLYRNTKLCNRLSYLTSKCGHKSCSILNCCIQLIFSPNIFSQHRSHHSL